MDNGRLKDVISNVIPFSMKKLRAEKVKRRNKDYRRVISLLFSAFPPDELIPVSTLRLLALIKNASFLAFYDGDVFVGFSYIVIYKGECYIFYLAVDDEVRGKGYGSMIISWIMENHPGMNIILDVEALEEGKANYTQRLKRIEFYRRLGITDTGYRLYDNNIKYMVLASRPDEFSPERMVKCWRSYAFGLYKNKPFRED